MKKWFSNRIVKNSSKKIVKSMELFIILQKILLALFLIVFFYLLLSERYLLSLAIAYLIYFPLVLIHFNFLRDTYKYVVEAVFLNEINLEKYVSITDELSKRGHNRYVRRESVEVLLLIKGQVSYFKGNFEDSLKEMNLVDCSKMGKAGRKKYADFYRFYEVLNLIFLDQTHAIEDSINAISTNKNRDLAQAVLTVMSGKTTDYFETVEKKNKLIEIETTYFQGLNLLNQDKMSESKDCFASIINENPDLFYVQEAKRYVEELD